MRKPLLMKYMVKYFEDHDEGTAENIAKYVRSKVGRRMYVSAVMVGSTLSRYPELFGVKHTIRVPYKLIETRELRVWETVN